MTQDNAGGNAVGNAVRPALGELSRAVSFNDPAAVKELLDRGADVEDVDKYGGTALMTAVVNGPEVMRLLIEHGADPHRKNNGGWSAMDYLEAERKENWWLSHEDYLVMRNLLDEAPEFYRRAEEARQRPKKVAERQASLKEHARKFKPRLG